MKHISIAIFLLVCLTSYSQESFQSISHKALENELIEVQADSGLVILIKDNEIVAKVNLNLDNRIYTEGDTCAFNQPRYIGGLISPFPMMIALKDKVLTPSDTVDVGNGTYTYKGARMTDHNYEQGGYGVLTAKQVFEYNSNIGMAKLMLKGYENDQMKLVSSMIGLGFPIDTANWSSTSLPWLAIGYETKISPIELIRLYGDIANNRIEGYENEISAIKDMMTIKDNPDDIKIAGKISSIITSKEKEVSFCSSFKVDGSLYTCLVIISNPKKGYPSDGIMTGNVIKEIVKQIH